MELNWLARTKMQAIRREWDITALVGDETFPAADFPSL